MWKEEKLKEKQEEEPSCLHMECKKHTAPERKCDTNEWRPREL